MTNKPATEERIWAVIAHLSALAMGMGLLLPIIGWSESRRKSNYTSFQCLQSLGYQSLGYTIWILVTVIVVVVVSLSAVAGLVSAANPGDEIFAFVTAHVLLMFGLLGVYFALPVIAAISCALGKDFRYPLMGNKLARYLGYDLPTSSDEQNWLIEDHEDRWVVAMGHFSVIIMLWGMLAPVTAWMVQGRRSLFLKFQSAQTVVFQAGALVLYFASMVLYFGGALFLLLSVGLSDAQNLETSVGMAGVVVFAGSTLCTMVIILIVPLLHIMGQWAGYRVLKGDDYQYPIIGKMVEKRIRKADSGNE